MTEYTTDDMSLACYLLYCGATIERLNQQPHIPKVYSFTLSCPFNPNEEVIPRYLSGDALVDARLYFQTIRQVKGMIINQRKEQPQWESSIPQS